MTVDKRKFLTILKNLYSGDRVLVSMGQRAQTFFEDEDREAFQQFQVDVGALFIELKEELDQGLEELADVHPEEPDPRKWDVGDWLQFHQVTEGHRFYEIYSTMAQGQPNINLIWDVIEDRLDLP